MSELGFPWRIDGRGRSAVVDHDRHVGELLEAVLFTAPGERVGRPDFGCGLPQLLFAPVDAAVVATAELSVRAGVQRWLSDVIELDDVAVELADTAVRVHLRYRVRATGVLTTASFEQGA